MACSAREGNGKHSAPSRAPSLWGASTAPVIRDLAEGFGASAPAPKSLGGLPPLGPGVRHLMLPGSSHAGWQDYGPEPSRSQPIEPFASRADDWHALEHILRQATQRSNSGSLTASKSWRNSLVDPDGARVDLGFLRLCTRRRSARCRGPERR